jgi:hypothetical protein
MSAALPMMSPMSPEGCVPVDAGVALGSTLGVAVATTVAVGSGVGVGVAASSSPPPQPTTSSEITASAITIMNPVLLIGCRPFLSLDFSSNPFHIQQYNEPKVKGNCTQR